MGKGRRLSKSMPKLAKIRLTGCHYAGMKLEHENSIFDLTQGSHGEHTLFTLKNGGGKGVLLQLLFQLLLPETRWGEHIKNYSYEEEDSLIEMFKSNLSITKDLPVLIKREGDYKELLAKVIPH